jgi:large subunit ribosomal protein L30e
MDIGREIRKAAETGKVLFGTERSLQAVKTGEAKLIIMASNTPQKTKEDIKYYTGLSGITTHRYDGTGVELGTACGKPFVISVIAVISPGDSNLLMVEGH